MIFYSQLLQTMSEKETVQVELPVLWGEFLGIKIPFSFIQKSRLLHFFMANYLQMFRLVYPMGIWFQRVLTFFFYLKENLLIFINKTNPTQMHSHTHKISETSVRIAGKQLTVMVT